MKKDKKMMDDMEGGVELSFKAVKPTDRFMDKYGISKSEVEHCYNTLKYAKEVEKDQKKMEAIKDFASKEIDTAEDMISSLDDLDAKIEKKFGSNRGKDVYIDEQKNNYDTNRKEDLVDED